MAGARGHRGTAEKALLTVLVVGLLGGLVSFGVLAAFSATTRSSGNEISTGTVRIADNDSGAALYNATNLKPGDSISRCIRVSHEGTLAAAVRIYANGTPGPLAQHLDLTISQGSQASPAFPSCSDFTADAGAPLFTGTLQQFEQTRTDYASAVPTAPSTWQPGSSRVYRVAVTLRANTPDSAQGASSGTHSFIWEGRSE